MYIIRIVASTFVFRWFVFCKNENNESLMSLDLLLLKMCNIIQCNGKYRQSYFRFHIINKLNVFLYKCLTFMIKMIYLSNFIIKLFNTCVYQSNYNNRVSFLFCLLTLHAYFRGISTAYISLNIQRD